MKRKYSKYGRVRCARVQELQQKGLSHFGQLLMYELLCGRLRGKVGANSGLYYPFTPEVAAKNIGIAEETIRLAIKELEDFGVAYYDDATTTIWVPEIWESEYISNGDHASGIAREILALPDNPFWEKMEKIFTSLFENSIDCAEKVDVNKRENWHSIILDALSERIGDSGTCVNTGADTSLITPITPISQKPKTTGSSFSSSLLSFFSQEYEKNTGKKHPVIFQKKVEERIHKIFGEIAEKLGENPEEKIQHIILQYFEDWKKGEIKGEDPTIWLFITPSIWKMRAYKTGYLDDSDVFEQKDGTVKSD